MYKNIIYCLFFMSSLAFSMENNRLSAIVGITHGPGRYEVSFEDNSTMTAGWDLFFDINSGIFKDKLSIRINDREVSDAFILGLTTLSTDIAFIKNCIMHRLQDLYFDHFIPQSQAYLEREIYTKRITDAKELKVDNVSKERIENSGAQYAFTHDSKQYVLVHGALNNKLFVKIEGAYQWIFNSAAALGLFPEAQSIRELLIMIITACEKKLGNDSTFLVEQLPLHQFYVKK